MILQKLFKDKDLYGFTEIERLLTYLTAKRGRYYRIERHRVKKLIKLCKNLNLTKLTDSVCYKIIDSVEVWKLIVKAMNTTI